jgi:ferredoxin
MKIKVNKEKCIGCGYCVSVCPEVFKFGEDGKSRVKEGVDLEKNKNCIKEAKEGCPVGAIEEY